MKERIGRSVKALRRFIDTSHNDDDLFLIAFNDRANLVQDFTTSGDNIVGHLLFVKPRRSTALYDAAYALELRHQYSIGFYRTDIASEAKWHKVQVKVSPPRGLGRLSLNYGDGYQSFKK